MAGGFSRVHVARVCICIPQQKGFASVQPCEAEAADNLVQVTPSRRAFAALQFGGVLKIHFVFVFEANLIWEPAFKRADRTGLATDFYFITRNLQDDLVGDPQSGRQGVFTTPERSGGYPCTRVHPSIAPATRLIFVCFFLHEAFNDMQIEYVSADEPSFKYF
jgi:hypothetical protein